MSHNEDVRKLCGALALLGAGALSTSAQVTVIDSGSTNVPGMRMTIEESGYHALVERKDGSKQRVALNRELCDRLVEDLKAAGFLNELPVNRCMKSVSFGKSIFIEYQGARTPDLSCRQADPRAAALKKDAEEILSAAPNSNATRKF
jgi:hypothetical protein